MENECCFFGTAMGTYVSFKAWCEPYPEPRAFFKSASFGLNRIWRKALDMRVSRALGDAFGEIRRLEAAMSAFSDKSDVARLNRAAGLSPVKVSSETMQVLKCAEMVSSLSKGAFDVTSGPLTSLWREAIIHDRLPKEDEIEKARGPVGYKALALEGGFPKTVSSSDGFLKRGLRESSSPLAYLSRPGMKVDLGGIAKGYAADRGIFTMVRSCTGMKAILVDFGGNIDVFGARQDGKPFRVGIQDPSGRRGDLLGVLEVSQREGPENLVSIVTSGDYERFFEESGVRYHHIIDPRTGYPARSDLRSVTCVARGSYEEAKERSLGLVADALSTAIFVLGIDEGLELVRNISNKSHLDIQVILVAATGEVYITRGLMGAFHPLKGRALIPLANPVPALT